MIEMKKTFEVGYIKLALLHCSYRDFTAINLSLLNIRTRNHAASLWYNADESSLEHSMKCRDPPWSSRWLQMPWRQICTNKSATMALHYSDVIMGAMVSQMFTQPFIRAQIKNQTSKFRVTGLWAGNSPVSGEFPAQRTSNAENISIWWRHHGHEYDYSRMGIILHNLHIVSSNFIHPRIQGSPWLGIFADIPLLLIHAKLMSKTIKGVVYHRRLYKRVGVFC